MTERQYNNPNFFQDVSVYRPGSAKQLETYTISQVWDGTLAGYRRLRRQCIETIEMQRDRTHLEYIAWPPRVIGGVTIPRQDKQSVTIS